MNRDAHEQPQGTSVNLAPGVTLGDYLLQEQIGRGGMGRVFRGWHSRMQRMVAIKVLERNPMSGSTTSVRRFEQEVRVSAQMTHPNLVRAYDAGEHQGIVYLVMEFLSGSDLFQLVKNSGPLTPELSLAYLSQTAKGLAHVHKHNLVHRDIKPSNIFLDDTGCIKILDLGLTSIRAQAPATNETVDGRLTLSGQILGTVDYLAPEQALNPKAADHRADIYGLGCTWYFLLTGKPPYTGQSITQRLIAHREAPLPHLSADLHLAEEWESMFHRMVAKNPDHRFASTQELLESLEQLSTTIKHPRTIRHSELALPATEVDTVPGDYSSIKGKTNTSHRFLVPALVGGVVLLLVLGILLAILFSRSQPNSENQNITKANKPKETTPTGTTSEESPDDTAVYPEFPADTSLKEKQQWLADELERLNPGYNGKRIEWEFRDGEVTVHLGDQHALKNIRPLSRMTFLTGVDFGDCRVSSLEPLSGMKRLFLINCRTTLITDLAPIRNLRLFHLTISGTLVKDLAPLKNMPLEYFDCNGCRFVTDLSPLKGMPIEELDCDDTGVTDLEVVKSLAKLRRLVCSEDLARRSTFLLNLKELNNLNGKRPKKLFGK